MIVLLISLLVFVVKSRQQHFISLVHTVRLLQMIAATSQYENELGVADRLVNNMASPIRANTV